MRGRSTTSHECFWRLRRVLQIPCEDAYFLADRCSRLNVLGDARLIARATGTERNKARLCRQNCRFCKPAPPAPASVVRNLRSDVKNMPTVHVSSYTTAIRTLEIAQT